MTARSEPTWSWSYHFTRLADLWAMNDAPQCAVEFLRTVARLDFAGRIRPDRTPVIVGPFLHELTPPELFLIEGVTARSVEEIKRAGPPWAVAPIEFVHRFVAESSEAAIAEKIPQEDEDRFTREAEALSEQLRRAWNAGEQD